MIRVEDKPATVCGIGGEIVSIDGRILASVYKEEFESE